MRNTFKDWLDSLFPPQPDGGTRPPASLQLATAVLLVEVMRAEDGASPAERAAVLEVLRERFDLAEADRARLLQEAEQASREATDYFSFTSLLDERLGMADKLGIIEAMWRVAYADGRLAAHEQHVLWRIADLLHVPHGAYINAKLRAEAAAGA